MTIRTEAELDDVPSRPSAPDVTAVGSLEGDLLILGAGGKMGPTLCVLAKRAMEEAGVDHPVIAVSRFSNPNERAWLRLTRLNRLSRSLK